MSIRSLCNHTTINSIFKNDLFSTLRLSRIIELREDTIEDEFFNVESSSSIFLYCDRDFNIIPESLMKIVDRRYEEITLNDIEEIRAIRSSVVYSRRYNNQMIGIPLEVTIGSHIKISYDNNTIRTNTFDPLMLQYEQQHQHQHHNASSLWLLRDELHQYTYDARSTRSVILYSPSVLRNIIVPIVKNTTIVTMIGYIIRTILLSTFCDDNNDSTMCSIMTYYQ